MSENGLSAAALILAAGKSGGGGGEPSQYIKNATVEDETLILTKKNGSTVEFENTDTTYSAGDGIDITSYEISVRIDGETLIINSAGELEAVGGSSEEEIYWVNYQTDTISDIEDEYEAGKAIKLDLDGKIYDLVSIDPLNHGAIFQNLTGEAGETRVLNSSGWDYYNSTFLTQDSSIYMDKVMGLQSALDSKQDTLTAGTNITIVDNVISASGGGGSSYTFTDGLTESSGVVSWDLANVYKQSGNVLTLSTPLNVGLVFDAGSSVSSNKVFRPSLTYSSVYGKNFDLGSSTYMFRDGYFGGNLHANNIPEPPTSDGNYVLTCSISSGVVTYSWAQGGGDSYPNAEDNVF